MYTSSLLRSGVWFFIIIVSLLFSTSSTPSASLVLSVAFWVGTTIHLCLLLCFVVSIFISELFSDLSIVLGSDMWCFRFHFYKEILWFKFVFPLLSKCGLVEGFKIPRWKHFFCILTTLLILFRCAVISVDYTLSPSWNFSPACWPACLFSSRCSAPSSRRAALCVALPCGRGLLCPPGPRVDAARGCWMWEYPSDPASQAPRWSHRGAGWCPWSFLLWWCQVPLCSPGELSTRLLSWLGEDLWCVGCILGLFPEASVGLSSSLLILVQSLIMILSTAASIPTLGTWLWCPGNWRLNGRPLGLPLVTVS